MSKLKLYSVFHLNLAFSSIPESQLPIVIERCYWPLLRLAKKFKGAIAIEATGYTIEKINELDPKWIEELSNLLKNDFCEFVGSGYSQLIGPLVPFEVNEKNLSIGSKIYKKILGVSPKVAYINEQSYSRGLIKIYSDAGYDAVIMEWDNSYQWHPEWDRNLRYSPQRISDGDGNSIQVIWNSSIAFQKFQRYAHGEMDLSEYVEYLESNFDKNISRFFPLYGSDSEVFDFRPGRYLNEPEKLQGEWQKIGKLFSALSKKGNMSLITPKKLLGIEQEKILRLDSAQYPIVVKKQEKYNIVRWALTGRDDIGSNTMCYRIFSKLKIIQMDNILMKMKESYEKENGVDLWKSLCFLWGSDFRTHTEERKYVEFKKNLAWINEVVDSIASLKDSSESENTPGKRNRDFNPAVSGKIIGVKTSAVDLKLNKRRGLTIDSLVFKKISSKPLIKILPHGYYEKISFGADFYTGHTIIEAPLMSKVTDLNQVKVSGFKNQNFSVIDGEVGMDLGKVKKAVTVYTNESRVDIGLNFSFEKYVIASFRTGIITLNPEAFDRETLFFRCHNGGKNPETFYLKDVDMIDVRPVSLLVTAQNILGNTTGCLEIGDSEKSIFLKNNPADLAALPMIHYAKIDDTYFLRVLYSLSEIDETSLLRDKVARPAEFRFNLSITAKKR